ncbi:glycoside hydrolase [Clavulina sp. PMI_390]|nr:glycoside hydrolase [Clavulina sp. PMI_390]
MPTEAPVSSSASLTSLTPSSSSSGPPAPVATGNPSTPVLATYYADWTSSDLLPEQIDFGRFDWVDFAFAVPTADFNLTFTEDDSVSLLTRLVKLAHTANPPKRVKLSVGGWDGSKYFSAAVSTPTNIATFVGNIVAAVKTYGVDGIDIDWEYPGVQGAGGNGVSPSDTTNFLSFLQQLRSQLGPSALLTAAVATSPFHLSSANTTEAASVFSSFGQVLDYILIMNYDVSDATASSPGSNAPLLSHGPSCPSSQDVVSAELAIDQWTAAGFPANKILLGVPSYGYMLSSSATTLSETPGRPSSQPGVANVVTDSSGQVQFNYLVQVGALVKNGTTPTFSGTGSYTRYWDACSSTPYLVSQSLKKVIPYDDPASLQLKAAYAMQRGLAGVNMFDVHGDTAAWDLVDGLRRGLSSTIVNYDAN